jgi:hypothetical protein
MSTYAELLPEHFYLLIENEGEEIVLLQPILETNNCLLLENQDDYGNIYWRKKSDPIYEIVDELSDEQVAIYDDLYEEEDEDELSYEDEEEDEDDL